MLYQLHWRKPPRDRRRLWIGLVITLLLHVVFGFITWYEMRPRPLPPELVRVRIDNALQVRLISYSSAHKPTIPPPLVAQPPPPPPAVPPLHVSHPAHEPVAKDAMTVSLPAPVPAPTPPPKLYDSNGQVLLPASAASTASSTPDYVQRMPQGDRQIMRNSDPIKYKPTRLEQYFPPPGETAAGAVVRHVVNTVVKTQEINLPGGVHLKCKTVLGIPTPECGIPPAAPPSTDGDERLSMASTPLAADPHAPKPPSVEECIAIYRASKPLPYGCPVDTPSRAVDAELRERAARGSGH